MCNEPDRKTKTSFDVMHFPPRPDGLQTGETSEGTLAAPKVVAAPMWYFAEEEEEEEEEEDETKRTWRRTWLPLLMTEVKGCNSYASGTSNQLDHYSTYFCHSGARNV